MPENACSLAGELTARLEKRPEVLFALLFGSQASGQPHAHSDIDIAVFVDASLSARQRLDLRLDVAGDLADLGVADVTVLNDAPALLGHQALMGTRLFVRDRSVWVRYFVKTIRESADQAYYRQIHATERRARLEAGTYGRP
ncbi:MAG: nucleotidyltransferase domain-containing protein [Polyangia bacterium]|jgi:predicted nucleotidyltransferase|nr:nucleotidyltransferase domain-containing protein [Polyangia bacterium]